MKRESEISNRPVEVLDDDSRLGNLENEAETPLAEFQLTARIEPFDTFWEAPEDIEKGYTSFPQFYRHNYLKYVPKDRSAEILVVSCGPGYFVHLLKENGYSRVLGIDSDPAKVGHARKRNLNCRVERAFFFLERSRTRYDLIFCEQELNHLTKEEMLIFLKLCRRSLKDDGQLIVHGLNGANPITGSEALAQNFDHYNTFTEHSLRQVLEHCGFTRIRVFPLNLYVFYLNPLNYVLIVVNLLLNVLFRAAFLMQNKKNRIFSKKLAAVCTKGS